MDVWDLVSDTKWPILIKQMKISPIVVLQSLAWIGLQLNKRDLDSLRKIRLKPFQGVVQQAHHHDKPSEQ